MDMQDIIFNKRNGLEMTEAEIDYLVKGMSDGSIPDYQIAAWAMAVFFRGLNDHETILLTMAMAYSGDVLDLSAVAGRTVDKHSTGGVGDKTTLIVMPLAAAAGVPMAKMSGRGLGHTGGTIDKFESIPGFQVKMEPSQFINQVNRVKAALISQTGNLVPADKRLYAIRDVTATIDSIPLIASSIMSKKIAAGARAILLDVKVGQGAFMTDIRQAENLARTMVEIGRGAGREVVAVLTDMDQPLGCMIGNALEVKEAIDTLNGKGPVDLESVCFTLVANILLLAEKVNSWTDAEKIARHLLESGAGLQKFKEMVSAQGGHLDFSKSGYGLPEAGIKVDVPAWSDGYLANINAHGIGRAAMLLGAGRQRIEDSIDPAAGIQLIKKKGDYVSKGDMLAVLHTNDASRIEYALPILTACYHFSQESISLSPAIIETIR